MKTHELKCWPHFFEAMERGEKTFEIRRNDRKYVVGDTLKLRKFDPSYGFIPGQEPLLFDVTYVMFDEDFPAIMPGFVIMGLERKTEARRIGEIVAELPVMKIADRCNRYREMAGIPYSKAMPCPGCIKGVCQLDEKE